MILEEACEADEEVAELDGGRLEGGVASVIGVEEEVAEVLVAEEAVSALVEAAQEVVDHLSRGRIGHGAHRRTGEAGRHGVSRYFY